MRCLFAHKWIIKASEFRTAVPYRICTQCGTVQRGIYDPFWRDITWETIRERVHGAPAQMQVSSDPSGGWNTVADRTFITPDKIHFVRKPTSRLDQWAHFLRLRRTRASDQMR